MAANPMRATMSKLLAGWLLLAGIAFAWSALATIGEYAWPQPIFDQLRQYTLYLGHDFPENLIQREAQHRPIVPNLVRVAEIHWFGANQKLQIAFGVLCVFLTAGLIARLAWRDRSLPLPARAAGFAAAWIALFWLAAARMLLHGNELVHAYLLTLCVIVGALATWRAARAQAARWMTVATVSAVIATFCFGPGIALFPALCIAALIAGLSWRASLAPMLGCIACLVIYLGVLPDNDNVRDTLELRPLDSLRMAARWIASPWMNAWLGLGPPPINAHHSDLLRAGNGWFLVESADWVLARTRLHWPTQVALAVGGAGFVVASLYVLGGLRRRGDATALRLVALVLAMFGAASAIIIGIGRLAYLEQHPDQVFADRYLVWPCLFWLGIALLLLTDSSRRGGWLRGIAVAVIALLPIVLWPTHELGAGWGASVYRNDQALGAAVRSDVYDAGLVWREDGSATVENKLQSFALFRERKLAMFAAPAMDRIGERWGGRIVDAPEAAHIEPPAPVEDVRDARRGARVSGTLPAAMAFDEDDPIVVLDARDTIVGYGIMSYEATGRMPLRFVPVSKRGFDAFVRGWSPNATYRLAVLDLAANEARVLGTLPR